MLDEFLATNRHLIAARTRERLAARESPRRAVHEELTNGIPAFLTQLGEALRLARSTNTVDHTELAKSAARHGQERLWSGVSIAQVVRDYGDVCQAVTELAIELDAPISASEFRTLNLCLDDAIAEAVTAFEGQSARAAAEVGTERLGVLAHELRNHLNTAMLSFEILKGGRVAISGSTGLLHGRSLMALRDLIDRSLADVRLDAGIERRERILVATFIEQVEISAAIQAEAEGLHFEVSPVDPAVAIVGDRQILAAAVSNLLQNAFKFSHKHGTISLKTRVTAERVLFEIEDECGGLPPGAPEDLFRPFAQRSADRRGVGLGLSICLKAARANQGEVRVRDLPGKGCVFTVDLPRSA